MNINYTGKLDDLPPKQRIKIEAKLAKVGKIIERRGKREAHVILTTQRHLHKAEITLNIYDRVLVGVGSDADLSTALFTAIEHLETQILKLRTKRRDTNRHAAGEIATSASAPPVAPATKAAKGKVEAKGVEAVAPAKKRTKVFRVNHEDGRKPMTLEEAMLEIGDAPDYLVYHDSKTDRVCTLLRRVDGHLDLIES